DALPQRGEPGAKCVYIRIVAPGPLCERGHLRLRGPGRHTRLQAPDERHRISPPIRFVAQRKWPIQINAASRRKGCGEIKGRRQNAHDGQRRIVECYRAAYDARIRSETPLPKAVTEQYYLRSVPPAFFGRE